MRKLSKIKLDYVFKKFVRIVYVIFLRVFSSGLPSWSELFCVQWTVSYHLLYRLNVHVRFQNKILISQNTKRFCGNLFF